MNNWLAAILTAGFITHPALAAEQTLYVTQDSLMSHLQETLPEAGLTVISQSATDRFALFYARASSDSHVTVTLRQLPAAESSRNTGAAVRTHISIVSDSPMDPVLEATVLRKLTADLPGRR